MPSSTAPKTLQESEILDELRQMHVLLSKPQPKNPLQPLGNGLVTLYRVLATHVLLLLLGVSLTAWWMLSDDSWKSYVQTGCNPSPELYSQKFPPALIAPKREMTIGELIEWQAERITQLTLAHERLLIDRDSIRAVCGANTGV